jgi:hypothetical protein
MAKINTQNFDAYSSVSGLGKTYFVQIQKDSSTGAFEAKEGNDVFGDAAGTVHILGTQEESTPSRDDNGVNSLDVTVFETDVDRLNMIDLVCPPSTTGSASEAEEVTLEDGQKKGGAGSGSGDDNKPYFLFYWFLQTLGGKKRCRVFVGQFNPQGGVQGQKGNQRNRVKFTITSVNAGGMVTTLPDDTTYPDFDGMSAPTLSGNHIHGKIIEAA